MKIKLMQGGIQAGHWCPACDELHVFNLKPQPPGRAKWTFNGDMERPTFTPSMRSSWKRTNYPEVVCHYFLRDGVIDYQGDCTHNMRGQQVPLPDIPEDEL